MKVSDIMLMVRPIALADICRGQLHSIPAGITLLPVVNAGGRYVGVMKRDDALYLAQNAELGVCAENFLNAAVPALSPELLLDAVTDSIDEAVVVTEDGQVVGMITAALMIRSLRKSLEEFRNQFSTIIDSAQNGILAVNSQGIVIIANRLVAEILGKKQGEMIGRQITEVIPHTLLPAILETKKPLLGQKITIGNTVVMANYSPIMSDGQVAGAISVFQDISILEDTSSELKYVKGLIQELEATINSSYDGMFITDGQGLVLRLNSAYERITGIKASEVVGKTMQQLVEEKYYDQSVTVLVMAKGERITINQTVKGNRKLLVTGNPIFDEEGKLFRVVTNVRDVTELSNLQEQLTQTKEQTLKYETELSHLRSLQLEEHEIIFRSRKMAQAIATATKVADVDSTVLITGDSGTGKELIAKLIHKRGKGIDKPFIKINCAALPEQLLESELFGYEGGAFTGAKKEGKPGLFELAHNGTLFLDEVGDMPAVLQVKLLRAIQEKEIMRVGGTKPIKVNVRIIAATHRNLPEMVETGSFRRDLYYRLMVVPIYLAPLRDRKEDIPLLIVHFMEKFNAQFGFEKTMRPELVGKLVDYSWPGNVRELENVIERMLVTSGGQELTVEHLPENLVNKTFLPRKGTKLKVAVEQAETFLLTEAYQEHQSWQKVAEVLDIDRATVYRKAKMYGLLKQ